MTSSHPEPQREPEPGSPETAAGAVASGPTLTVAKAPEARDDRFYLPEVDALRFFAFLVVFVHHAFPQNASFYTDIGFGPGIAAWLGAAVTAGGFGVDLFLVLSSFLITELLLREQAATGTVAVGKFYIRRALRIWPLYFAFIGICAWLIPGDNLQGRYLVAFALFGANWACVLWHFPSSMAAPLWSVSIEEQFYLVWPVLVRKRGPRFILGLALAMLATGIATRAYLGVKGAEHPGIWCNTLARLDPIAWGILLAVFLHRKRLKLGGAARLLLLGGALGMWSTAMRFGALDGRAGPVVAVLTYAAAAWGAVALVLAFVHLPAEGVLAALLRNRLWVYLGRISYGLYVFHVLGIHWGHRLVGSMNVPIPLPFATPRAVALGLTIAMAAASYHWFEKPFLRLKNRFTLVASRPSA